MAPTLDRQWTRAEAGLAAAGYLILDLVTNYQVRHSVVVGRYRCDGKRSRSGLKEGPNPLGRSEKLSCERAPGPLPGR